MPDEDDNLAAKALQGGVLSDDQVRTVIDRLMGIVSHPKAPFRAITAAARVLLQNHRSALEADVIDRLEALEEGNEQENY